MLGRKKSQVGLDIGSHSLKVIEVLSSQEVLVANNIGVQELPPNHSEEDLPNAIRSLFTSTGIATKEVNISISGSGVVVRFMVLPIMQESELSQALPYEAEKYIPFDAKDMVLDHVVLEKDESQKKMKILLVAAKKDFVEKRISLLENAGFAPNIVDVDSFALFNAFTKNVSRDKRGDKIVALLNIGDHLTNILIVRGDNPCMVRDVNLGGSNMRKISKVQQSGVVQRLIDEIKISFTYYENQYGSEVDEVYISGGGIKLDGLITFLKESMGMEFMQWDPLSVFVISPQVSKDVLENFGPSLAVCSGLALRQ